MAYTTLTAMRAEEGLSDTSVFTDDEVNAAIALAEAEIDRYCFTSFEYKTFTSTLNGNNRRSIILETDEGYPILYPRTITSATLDGVTETTTGWALHPDGVIIRDDGTWTWNDVGRNVVISGTAGLTSTADVIIQWACRKLARFHLLDDVNRNDDRAMSVATDYGNINLAHASNHPERMTALPEVNARLAKYRQYSGGASQ